MIQPITTRLIKQLKSKNLPLEDRVALTTALLSNLSALPLNNAIVIDPHGVEINGKRLSPDDKIAFIESCALLKNNFARKVLHEQVRYLAINLGVHIGQNTDMIMFSKAALWCLEQEEKLLEKIV